MTIVVIWPNLRLIIGPCFLESFAKDLCGWSPNKWRLPMNGNGDGPGGRFLVLLDR